MTTISASSSTPMRRLVLQNLTEDAWRLCDTGAAPGDAANLIAYIEKTSADTYDAVWVGLRSGTSRHSSLDEIIAVASTLLNADQPRSTKPIAIASRSPFTPGGAG